MNKDKQIWFVAILLLIVEGLAGYNAIYAQDNTALDSTIPTEMQNSIDASVPVIPEGQIQPSIVPQSEVNFNDIEKYQAPELKAIPPSISVPAPINEQSEKLLKEIPLRISENQLPVSLEECLRKALENNFDIKIITAQREQNKWLYYNALSDYLPDINWSYFHMRFSGAFLIGGVAPSTEIPGFSGNISATSLQSDLSGTWYGFTGFSRLFKTRAAKAKYNATKKNLEFTQDQILVQVATEYYDLLRDKLNIDIRKKALEQTESQLKINQVRFVTGVGTKFDVLRAVAEVAKAQQNLIVAYNRLKLSQAQLANTMGIDVFAPLMPTENEVQAKALLKENLTLSQITQIALKSRLDISIAELNVAAVRAQRNLGYSKYLPSVGVRGNLEHIGSDLSHISRNQSAALIMNWTGGDNMFLDPYTNIRALNEQLKESRLKVATATRNVEQNIVNSYYNSISANEVIKASEKEVGSAKESLRLSVVRLKAGVGIYTDVIAAQLTETNARITYLDSLIEYNRAQAQLLFDMGVISVNNLLQGYDSINESQPKKK